MADKTATEIATAEIDKVLNFRTGKTMWSFTVWHDRGERASGGLTKGKRAGSIVAESLPELLRQAADLIDQEGPEDLLGVADVLIEAQQ